MKLISIALPLLLALPCHVQAASCVAAPSGLVGWWRAENSASDSAGTNNGVLVNSVYIEPGLVGQCFHFVSGPNPKVRVPDSPALQLTNSLTIEGWIKANLGWWILNRADDEVGGVPYGLCFDGSLHLRFIIHGTFSDYLYLDAPQPIPTNVWLHVAATLDTDAGTARIYVNGQVVAETNTTIHPMGVLAGPNAGLGIGNAGGSAAFPFDGWIDEISLYSRALSQTDIQAIYAAGSAGKCVPVCAPPPTGLVGSWCAEGNATDSAGTNTGVLINGAGFAPGEVGQSFVFTNFDQCVQIPDAPALDPTNGLSLEGWVLLSKYPSNNGVIVVSKDTYNVLPPQYQIAVYQTGSNSVFQISIGVIPSGMVTLYGSSSLQTNTWYHVAITYDTAELRLYVNGQPETSMPVAGSVVTTTGTLKFGGYGFGLWTLPGQLDEVSLYNRPLSSSEVQALYSAGSAGKCPPVAPFILSQPQGQVGYWGRSVTFTVTAGGTPPPGYLWYKDGFPISWATNSSLVLTNLSLNEGGSYWVVVSNMAGSFTSSNAFLTVNPAGVSLGLYPGLTIEGAVGNTYGIQYTTNVSQTATWVTLDQITLTQPVQQWFDTSANVAAGNNPRRFYRVVAVP